jgi:polyhydroxyalkanoate synthase subunit PhaC
MVEIKGTDLKLPDPVELSRSMVRIAERSQRLVSEFLARQSEGDAGSSRIDPLSIGGAFMEMTGRMISDPAKLIKAQMALAQDYLTLLQRTTRRLLGGTAEPVVTPARDDKRFRDTAWDENTLFDFIKQSYLLSARWLQSTVRDVEGLDEKTARKLDFYTRQFVDAMAPSNFILTNPEVLKATLESGGENLVHGLENLLRDLERGRGSLAISMTDYDKFEVGRNIAVTPGAVVYQNELMQLIQYAPTTAEQHKRPLLIIPPWINKFYILDLKPENSLVKWLTDQGHTVFIISWVNPTEALAEKTWDDYMTLGPLAAFDAIEKATGERELNVIGYCIGGTLLSSTLGYLARIGDKRVQSAMYLVTLVDFSEPGELSVFIDEEQLAALEQQMHQRGVLSGQTMATTFNMLRANDLIWSFVVNNYLLGKDPFPFDLLYWNSDSTRMPAAMHSYYLRNMYQKNLLCEPGGLTVKGHPIDLRQIKVPTFMLSTREDHITPWKSTYAATQLYSGPVKFVLASSGHIAGVVNPPVAGKYSHYLGANQPKNPEQWLEKAKQVPGSWWPEYARWLIKYAGPKVPARQPGDGTLPVIEAAPGSYVKVKTVA